jgi:hypothetical protein
VAKTATVAKGRGRKPGAMSDHHKEALAEGREQGRIVRAYLEALDPRGTGEPGRRHRRRSLADIDARLVDVDRRMAASSSVMVRLHLAQERVDLERARAASDAHQPDVGALEARFVKVAAAYSERKGVSWAAWREAGVPVKVLRAAGVR